MPIRPERLPLYPDEWASVSRGIVRRANDRCEECGIPNRTVGYRWPTSGGDFQGVPSIDRPTVLAVLRHLRGEGARLTKIVLTVHHRDGDPTNNRSENLVALCQRCHLRADRALRDAAKEAGKS